MSGRVQWWEVLPRQADQIHQRGARHHPGPTCRLWLWWRSSYQQVWTSHTAGEVFYSNNVAQISFHISKIQKCEGVQDGRRALKTRQIIKNIYITYYTSYNSALIWLRQYSGLYSGYDADENLLHSVSPLCCDLETTISSIINISGLKISDLNKSTWPLLVSTGQCTDFEMTDEILFSCEWLISLRVSRCVLNVAELQVLCCCGSLSGCVRCRPSCCGFPRGPWRSVLLALRLPASAGRKMCCPTAPAGAWRLPWTWSTCYTATSQPLSWYQTQSDSFKTKP